MNGLVNTRLRIGVLASSKVGDNMPYKDYVFWSFVAPIDQPEGFENW